MGGAKGSGRLAKAPKLEQVECQMAVHKEERKTR